MRLTRTGGIRPRRRRRSSTSSRLARIRTPWIAQAHRRCIAAVRTRSFAAVQALVDGGADSRRPNKAGSTPLHLAVQTTGRGGSGSPQAREQQASIIREIHFARDDPREAATAVIKNDARLGAERATNQRLG